MTWIVEVLGGVRATIFAGLTLAAVAAVGVQSYRLGNAQDANDDLRAEKIVAEANEKAHKAAETASAVTIAALQQQLDTVTGQNQQIEAARAGALTALAAAERERASATAAASKARRDLYAANQQAAEWAARALPRGVSDRLRDVWTDARCRSDRSPGRSEGSSACPAPGTADHDPATAGLAAAALYDGDQLLGALDTCLSTLGQAQDQIGAIAQLQRDALSPPTAQ